MATRTMRDGAERVYQGREHGLTPHYATMTRCSPRENPAGPAGGSRFYESVSSTNLMCPSGRSRKSCRTSRTASPPKIKQLMAEALYCHGLIASTRIQRQDGGSATGGD